jgi:hypothetical protein
MSCISIIDTRPFNFSIAAQTSRRGPKGHSGIVRPVSPLVPICPLNQIAHKYYYSSGHPCPFQIISNSHNVQFTRLFRTRHDHNLWYLVRTVLRVSPRYTMKVTFNVSPPPLHHQSGDACRRRRSSQRLAWSQRAFSCDDAVYRAAPRSL